ncbi:hypothetical protein AHAS_Ahas01G0138300 [Arachis hypogaea]
MAPKSATIKTLRDTRKNVVAWGIQLKEVGDTGDTAARPSPTKSDSGTSSSRKVIFPLSRPTPPLPTLDSAITRPPFPSSSELNPKR